jgi:hypothetical protein
MLFWFNWLWPHEQNETKTMKKLATLQRMPDAMNFMFGEENFELSNFAFSAPSPRQRCRIRTNPWFFTAEAQATLNGDLEAKKNDMDTASTSSGIKSNSDGGAEEKNDFKNG